MIKLEEENMLMSSRPKHCSNCRWDDDGDEYWHCDHSINDWTGEPFYPECDYYL